jgi:nucleotide-binding universal stress UspA family protein
MISLKTILAPVDFSERSTHAAEHAVALASHFRAKVVLTHVIPPSPMEYAAFEGGYYTGATWPSDRELQLTVEKQLQALADKVRVESDIQTRILTGDPAQEIERLAQELKADLLVMSTHGYGPFRRFILGSVTAKVLHDVSCPVFTGAHVPELAPFNREPYRRIACAVNLGPQSEDVLRWAWDFARAYEEDLTVIHAAPLLESGGPYGDIFPADTRKALVDAARAEVDRLIDKVGCRAQVRIECADPASFVHDVADKGYMDLLIIGRSPRHGILGRLRTQAYAIIREAPCPVISV